MNRQCEYSEYKGIMTTSFLIECKNPYFRWKNKFANNENPNLNENLTPETFVQSDVRRLGLHNAV